MRIQLRFKKNLHSGRAQFPGRALNIVHQKPRDRPSGEVTVHVSRRSKDFHLAAIRQLQYPNPGARDSARKPNTSRKKATVGASLSVRVPSQANLMMFMVVINTR